MYRHCTIDELLALRDGRGTDGVQRHVEACEPCRVELDRVHQRRAALKALSSVQPPRDRWLVVREAVLAERRRVRGRRLGWSGLAAAAAVALIAGVTTLRSGPTAAPVATTVAIDSLVDESQRLEDMLHAVTARQGVMDGYTASAVAAIEDRIAAVDQGIGQAQVARLAPQELERLWGERVRLMDQLLTTHVTRTAYVGY